MEINPKRKGQEYCKAITLRSGKELNANVEKHEPLIKPLEEEKEEVGEY